MQHFRLEDSRTWYLADEPLAFMIISTPFLHIIGTISMCMSPCQGTFFCFNSEGQVYDQEVGRSLYPVVCNVSALITRKIDTWYLYSIYIGEVIKGCVKIFSLWMNVWCWRPRNNEKFVIRTNSVNKDASVCAHMCRNKFKSHILTHVQWAFSLLNAYYIIKSL